MIRDVVIHIHNEQSIRADLVAEPDPTAVALICRNVRTMAGGKPLFVDRADSTFIIPLAHIRFIEMPLESMDAAAAERASEAPDRSTASEPVEGPVEGLARLGRLMGREETGDEADAAARAEPADGTDLDDELLRRIREV
ncbi:MAG: hypothetical protein ABSE58_03770 [Candidatus Limnocylindrales bacterium]|jgi:hypothetical protein